MQLLAPLAGRKVMLSASHIAEEMAGGVMHRGGGLLGGQTLYLQSCVHSRSGRGTQKTKHICFLFIGKVRLNLDLLRIFVMDWWLNVFKQ